MNKWPMCDNMRQYEGVRQQWIYPICFYVSSLILDTIFFIIFNIGAVIFANIEHTFYRCWSPSEEVISHYIQFRVSHSNNTSTKNQSFKSQCPFKHSHKIIQIAHASSLFPIVAAVHHATLLHLLSIQFRPLVYRHFLRVSSIIVAERLSHVASCLKVVYCKFVFILASTSSHQASSDKRSEPARDRTLDIVVSRKP